MRHYGHPHVGAGPPRRDGLRRRARGAWLGDGTADTEPSVLLEWSALLGLLGSTDSVTALDHPLQPFGLAAIDPDGRTVRDSEVVTPGFAAVLVNWRAMINNDAACGPPPQCAARARTALPPRRWVSLD